MEFDTSGILSMRSKLVHTKDYALSMACLSRCHGRKVPNFLLRNIPLAAEVLDVRKTTHNMVSGRS